MSNFKFLLSEPGMATFADVAIAAEKILHIDPAACGIWRRLQKHGWQFNRAATNGNC